MSDELRQLFENAHRDDAPLSFQAVLNKQPRARRAWLPAVSVTVTAMAMMVVVIAVAISRRAPPSRPPPLRIAENGLLQTPLDFLLLQPQGQQLFSETPRFDARGLP